MITRTDIDHVTFRSNAHYNMGKDGYGYGYECEELPRLRFIDRHYRPNREHPDGRNTRTWCVDGAELESLDAAVAALNLPPVITPEEDAALAQIPLWFVGLREMEDILAGVPRPEGAIEWKSPHSVALMMIEGLRAKGLVELGKRSERGDGQPWSDAVPEHCRWTPTIRRRSP